MKGEICVASKQDITSVRKATDLERKYNFGKTFSDVLGLINDSRDKVDSVESSLRDEIVSTSTSLRRDTEKIEMEVTRLVENGIDRVETTTGYRFDHKGLSISKSGEEMSNLLDNTGMYVKRGGDEILVANNKGVNATNLHAKTYLIIGSGEGRSRFEDYGTNRTGCYWIGGY